MSVTRAYIADTPFDQFDPNSGQGPEVAWGLYGGGSWRTWATRGGAVSASHHVYGGFKLYKFVNGRWEFITGRPQGLDPEVCQVCGNTTMKPRMHYNYQTPWNSGKWAYERASRSKLADPLNMRFACQDCR